MPSWRRKPTDCHSATSTSYRDLLDATRRDLAIDYLRQGRYSLADVAFLLSFTDQANFTRAFRRWTGKTPRAFLS